MNRFFSNLLNSFAIAGIFFSGFADVALAETRGLAETKALNDAQIVHIVVMANNGEIDESQLAKNTSNADLKALADKMVKDHTESNVEVEMLARKLNLKMEKSEESKTLKKNASAEEQALKSLKGKEFDRAYIDHMVVDHEAVLRSLDEILIPNATEPQLKSLLVATRAKVADHLTRAKIIQTQINR